MAAQFRSPLAWQQARAIVAPRPKALADEQKPSLGAHRIGWSGRDELHKAHSLQSRTLDWSLAEGGSVGTIRVSSAGAAALRVALEFVSLPDGTEVTVTGSVDIAGGHAPTRLPYAQVAAARAAPGDAVWTPVTSGETQIVEVFVPGVAPGSAPVVIVADVSHLVVNPLMRSPAGATRDDAPKLLACHENYSCMPAGTLRDAGRAVAKIVITTPEGTGLCSGALLTDRTGTGTPWFATAHHCGVTTSGVAASVQFIWYYEQQCGGSARMIVLGYSPLTGVILAIFIGFAAGCATGLLNTRLKINSLLAGILMMTILYSVNLRVMGRSNTPLLKYVTLFTPFEQMEMRWLSIVLFFSLVVFAGKFLTDLFLHTHVGLAMRATGDNEQMIRTLGVNTDNITVFGLGISNAFVALSGALVAQHQGFADIGMGIGMIVAGVTTPDGRQVSLADHEFQPTGEYNYALDLKRVLSGSYVTGMFMVSLHTLEGVVTRKVVRMH